MLGAILVVVHLDWIVLATVICSMMLIAIIDEILYVPCMVI